MNAFTRTPMPDEAIELEPRGRAAVWTDRLQLLLGLVGLVASVALVVTGILNRSLQTEIAAGQAKIANAQTAANVNNSLIRLLAKAAAEKGDDRIRDLLARNGITYAPAATPAAAQEAK